MAESDASSFVGTARIGRLPYLLIGLLLVGVKYVIDQSVAAQFGQTWTPWNYLFWPNVQALRLLQLSTLEREFALSMLAVALPFIVVGVFLTLMRLRDAGLPLGLACLFFVPVVNVLFFGSLSVIPSAAAADQHPSSPQDSPTKRYWARLSTRQAMVVACLISIAVSVSIVYLGASLLQSYGLGIFVAGPFIQGWLAASIFGYPRERTLGQCLGIAMIALVATGAALMVLAIEGLICILMAAPLALPLSVLGGCVGYLCQKKRWINRATPTAASALLIILPILMIAESRFQPSPQLRAVRTEIYVDAMPEHVWAHVVEFPPLSPPRELIFRAGIAYPTHARIIGHGVGAERHCVFSTGTFVEPIEVWDEPRHMAFRVTEQPASMHELSFFDIHPPHLMEFLVSHRGEFRLDEMPGGGTRLQGTTWYTNRMWPAWYWYRWSDEIIHRIHRRVLDHVRDLSETSLDEDRKLARQ